MRSVYQILRVCQLVLVQMPVPLGRHDIRVRENEQEHAESERADIFPKIYGKLRSDFK